MAENISQRKSRRPLGMILVVAGLVLVAALAFVLGGQMARQQEAETVATPAAVTLSPESSSTPAPACAGGEVEAGLDAILAALQADDSARAQAELDATLSAYADLMGQPVCGPLAQELLGLQALVAASTTWKASLESGSVRQVEEAARLAALADELVSQGESGELQALAAGLVEAIERRSAALAEALDPARTIANPATLSTELAGGLHPLCEVNTIIKPLLADQSGGPILAARRMLVYSDTLFLLAGGQLMMADAERIFGHSPAVFLQTVAPEGGIVAGARVEELVDLTPAENGDLLLLEKSGRVLRRGVDGNWSLERRTQPGEMPVAIAPYGSRFYLLDPDANQVWRYPAETEGYVPAYFAQEIIRNTSRGVDMAIDGAIYVARYDGWVRRYYVGVEDPDFRPDTDLGLPAAIFLPDEVDSTLVYVVDGPGRRLLGLDRETGLYRLGFALNVEGVDPLTSGAINSGRLYLTDGKTLFITALTPTPTPAIDCPAFPFSPVLPFDLSVLETMEFHPPVDATMPISPSLYPGGRWPQLGYGVLEGLAFTGQPYSDTVRAVAPGIVSRILIDPPLLLETDLGVISTTGKVPSELQDAVWGKQVWLDLGNGVEARYGGLAGVLPALEEGQTVRLFTILGFAGEGPVFLGLWVDGQYVGYNWSVPETIIGYHALFEQ